MTSEEKELLLLRYWDGLLEDDERHAATELLATDPMARTYLKHLEGLQQTFDEWPVPGPTKSLLPVQPHTDHKRHNRAWAVAASLAILGTAIGLQWKQAQQNPAIEPSAENVAVVKTLRYAYRERDPNPLDHILDSRQRLERLRSQVSGRTRFPNRHLKHTTEKPPC